MPAMAGTWPLRALSAAERSRWLPVAVALVALGIRLVGLGERSLWLDEAFAVSLGGRSLSAIRAADPYFPPLYPLLLKGWMALGPWFTTDAGVRMPSALASATGIGLAVWLARRLRLPGIMLIAALGALSSLSFWYAQEARSVALAGCALLACAACLALVASSEQTLARRTSWGIWGVYVLAALSALYLHYDAIPVLLALNVWFFALTVLVNPRASRGVLLPWLLAQTAVVVLYAPQIPALAGALRSINNHPYARTYAPFAIVTGVIVLASPIVWVAARKTVLRWLGVLSWIVVGGILTLFIAELVPAGSTIKRHLAVVFPAALVPVAAISARRLRPMWQLALVVAALPSLLLAIFVHPKEPWREVAAGIQTSALPSDSVAVFASYVGVPFERYYRSQRPGQVQLLHDPRDISQAFSGAPPSSRLWLVESHAEDVGKGSPVRFVPADWALACENRFYRVTVRRFERSTGRGDVAQTAGPPPCR
jgi:hypothetical protein